MKVTTLVVLLPLLFTLVTCQPGPDQTTLDEFNVLYSGSPRSARLIPRSYPENLQSKRPRISFGDNAQNGKFPFMAYITDEYFDCSGSLIAPRVVLTAAHCVYDKDGWSTTAKDLKVYIGNVDYTKAKKYSVKVGILESFSSFYCYCPASSSWDHFLSRGFDALETVFFHLLHFVSLLKAVQHRSR